MKSEIKNTEIQKQSLPIETIAVIFALILIFSRLDLAPDQSFSAFAVADEEKMKLIIGKWKISSRQYVHEYTNEFARRIDGFPYYRYNVSQYPGMKNNLYALFKSKKTGKSYFCRGTWHTKYGFQYSASRIVFRGKDKFIVFTRDDPGKIYFTAERMKNDDKKKN